MSEAKKANEYPLKTTIDDTDESIGIDSPDEETWSIQRMPIGRVYNEIISALNNQGIYPGEIIFETTGSVFEPVIVLTSDSTATVEWIFSDGTTSDSTTPSITFDSAETRIQRLKVTPWKDLYRINLGYFADEGGSNTDEAGNTFEYVTSQQVAKIINLDLVKDSLVYLCGSGTPLTSIDVSGFTALYGLEFYGCSDNLASVNIYNTSNLRRACFELSYVGFLDFSKSPLIEDIRASYCHLQEIRFGTEQFLELSTMSVRGNADYLDLSTWPEMTQFPSIENLQISGNDLIGDLEISSTSIASISLYDNDFTTIDLTGAFPDGTGHVVNAYDNANLTQIIIDDCPAIGNFNASGCALTRSNIDYILNYYVANAISDVTIDLSGGTSDTPSIAGYTNIDILTNTYSCTISVNDPIVPTLQSATIDTDGTTWTFVFDEDIAVNSGSGFAITMVTAGVIDLTYVSGHGTDTLIYTGDVVVEIGDTVSSGLDYTQPGNGLENFIGDDVVSFTDVSVTNNSTVDYPILESTTIDTDGTTWTFVFDQTITVGSGGSGGFAITMDEADVIALTYVSGSESDTLIYSGDVVVNGGDTSSSGLDFTQPGNGLENVNGYDLQSFTGASIINDSQEGPPILLSAVIGDSGSFWTFYYNKDVTFGDGGTGGFTATMDIAGEITLMAMAGDGTDTWSFYGSPTVYENDTVSSGLDYTQPEDGYQDEDGNDLVSFTGGLITNNSTLADPTLLSAIIGEDGLTWTFTFDHLMTIGTGGSDGFVVTMADAGTVTLTYSSGDGGYNLMYTGDVTVSNGDTVSSGLDYTQPGDGLENSGGYELVSFTGKNVVNGSVVGPPVLESATIGADGLTWTFIFNKDVNVGTGGSDGFAVTMTTAGVVTLTYSSGDGSETFVYTGDVTVSGGDTVSSGLDFTQPTDGLEDDDGNDLESFTGATVINDSEVGPPVLESATIGADGLTWTLVFNEAITIGTGGSDGFVVIMTNAGTVTLTYDSGDTTDTLVYIGDVTVYRDDTVSSGLDYTQPTDGLEDSDGNDLVSFTGGLIINNSLKSTTGISLVSYVEALDDDYSSGFGVELSAPAQTHTQGNLIAVFATCYYFPVEGITDTQGNTYNIIKSATSGWGFHAVWFYTFASETSENIVTSYNNGYLCTLHVIEFSGVDTNNPIDIAEWRAMNSAGITCPVDYSMSSDDQILMLGTATTSALTCEPTEGWTLLSNLNSTVSTHAIGYKYVETAETDSATLLTTGLLPIEILVSFLSE